MEKFNLENLSKSSIMLLHQGNTSRVYKTKDGEVIKTFFPAYLSSLSLNDMDLEDRVLNARPLFFMPEIVMPTAAAYLNDAFVGYKMPFVEGINLEQFSDGLSVGQKADLRGYATLYSMIERVIKRDSSIVFPDLCTIDNIMITREGNIRFVDYDGIQIGNMKSPCISTLLGNQSQYNCPKYLADGKYTKELDIKSLIYFYFINTFNVDLNFVGTDNPISGGVITLDDVFDQIRLDDDDMKHKVWKVLQTSEKNEYLGDDVFRVAEKYRMRLYEHPVKAKTYIKILEKK